MKKINLRDLSEVEETRLAQMTEDVNIFYNCMEVSIPGFERRESQITGTVAMIETMLRKVSLLGEYPCGSGKSFMYILASMIYTKNNPDARTIIVTENISLQEQLGKKDLPTATSVFKEAFGEDAPRFKILKGRANYLCNKKMEIISQGIKFKTWPEVKDRERLVEIDRWFYETRTGDFSELYFIPDRDAISELTVKDTSSGGCATCEHKENGCFYLKEKALFMKAPIAIVNYHLLFTGMFKDGMRERILGRCENFVFDEAHNLSTIAREFDMMVLSNNEASRVRKVLNGIMIMAADTIPYRRISFKFLDVELADLELSIRIVLENTLSEIGMAKGSNKQSISAFTVVPNIRDTIDILCTIRVMLDKYIETAIPEIVGALYAQERLDEAAVKEGVLSLLDDLDEVIQFCKALNNPDLRSKDCVYWLEADDKGACIRRKPFLVGDKLSEYIFSNVFTSAIVVSATLAVNANFNYLHKEIGIKEEDERIEIIEQSPFDIKNQELWYLPESALAGNHPNQFELDDVNANNISDLIHASGGGVLCLFTSIKSMDSICEKIRRRHPKHRIFKQGEMPRNAVLKKFANDRDSILFATKSFFTGIDVKGASLRVLVIDKIPFESPEDPVQKKLNNLENGFYSYAIPGMIMALKQAIGRGIRSKTDKCVVMILDSRLATANYKTIINRTFAIDGKYNSRTRSIEDVRKFLGDYKKEYEMINEEDAYETAINDITGEYFDSEEDLSSAF